MGKPQVDWLGYNNYSFTGPDVLCIKYFQYTFDTGSYYFYAPNIFSIHLIQDHTTPQYCTVLYRTVLGATPSILCA